MVKVRLDLAIDELEGDHKRHATVARLVEMPVVPRVGEIIACKEKEQIDISMWHKVDRVYYHEFDGLGWVISVSLGSLDNCRKGTIEDVLPLGWQVDGQLPYESCVNGNTPTRRPMEQTKTCPSCGKNMILRSSGIALMTYPPQYPRQWWCGCGHSEAGPILRGKTEAEASREAWEKANGINTQEK